MSKMSSNPTTTETGGGESGSSSEYEFIENSKKLPPPSALPVFNSEPTLATLEELKTTTSCPPLKSTHDKSVKDDNVEEDEDNLSSFGFGWMSASSSGGLLSKMAEKTKSSFETVITTLDPQMKDYLSGKNNIPFSPAEVVVASDQKFNVTPVSNAFRSIFGTKTAVYGLPSKTESIAEQPVGFAAGRQGAKERMNSLSSDADVKLSLENFLLEVGEDTWVEMIVLILLNSKLDITVTTYSQPVYVDVRFVDVAKEATLESYPKKWSGLQKSIASVIGEHFGSPHQDWYAHVTGGTTREEILFLASETLAKMYKKVLCERVEHV
ncbi:protein PRRC1 [Lepeophtheirus salmonis]|uniref:protein PRRC1 n=1 Tax=Lepeophtheirus salmonis TaxID=72036 RepID=UPI001AE69637|nr:protein PRRC1-like [Lepeophtheirus salmonis]